MDNSHHAPADPDEKLCNASLDTWAGYLGARTVKPTDVTWETRTPVYARSRACARAGFAVMKAPLDGTPDPNMYMFDVGGALRFLKRACNDGEAIASLVASTDFKTNPRNITAAEALEYSALACTALHDLTVAGLVAINRDTIDAQVCAYAHDPTLTTPRSASVTKQACGVWNMFSSVLPDQWLTGQWTNREPVADVDVADESSGQLPGRLAQLQSAAPGSLGDETWALLDTELSFVDPGSLDIDALTSAIAPHIDALLAAAVANHSYLAVEQHLPNVISALQRFERPETKAILSRIKAFEDKGAAMFDANAAKADARYPATRAYDEMAAKRLRHQYEPLSLRIPNSNPASLASARCVFLGGVLEPGFAPVIDVPVDVDVTIATCRDDRPTWDTTEQYEYQETVTTTDSSSSTPQTTVVTQEISHTGAADWSHYSSGETVTNIGGSSNTSATGGGHSSHYEVRTGTRTVHHQAVDFALSVTFNVTQKGAALGTAHFDDTRHQEDTSYQTPHGSKQMTLDMNGITIDLMKAVKIRAREAIANAGAPLAVADGAAAEKRGDMAAAEDAYAKAVLLGTTDARAIEVVTKKFGGLL